MTTPGQPGYVTRGPRRSIAEDLQFGGLSDADRTVLHAFAWSAVLAKVAASMLILWYFPSWHTAVIVAAVSASWIGGGLVYLERRGRGPLRLLRARCRRSQLLRQEFQVRDTGDG